MAAQKRVLISTSLVLLLVMAVLVPRLTVRYASAWGYVLSNLVYWCVFCMPCVAFLMRGRWAEMTTLYRSGNRDDWRFHLLAFLPAVATFFIAFLPVVGRAPLAAIVIALLYAFVNGTVEELFWRGMYAKVFGWSAKALLFSAVVFGSWHVALALAKGIAYHGGPAALIGGAAAMGCLWSVVACRTHTLRYITCAHILTNFFAFSEFIVDNWF